MPEPKPGKVEKFKFSDKINDLASLGLGIYTYFYFVKFLILTLVICSLMVAAPNIYMARSYNQQLKLYCGNRTDAICTNFNSKDNDWLYSMNSDNTKIYTRILETYNNENIIYTLEFSFINFLTMVVIIISVNFFIIIMDANTTEIDMFNTTPTDYTLMISNLPKNINTKEEVLEYLTLDGIRPHEICLTYKIIEFQELKKQYIEYMKIVKYLKLKKLNVMKKSCGKALTLEEAEIKLNETANKLNEYIDKIEKYDEQLFTGVVFAIFKTSGDYDIYKDKFPNSFFGYMWMIVKYIIARCFLCCCIKEEKIKSLRNKLVLRVEKAAEPSDVIWENLEVSGIGRIVRTVIVYLSTVIILVVSFFIILGLNKVQTDQNKSKSPTKYGISVLISIIVSTINFIVELSINWLTTKERTQSLSDMLLSNSVKLQMVNI
jgi:hypothetical protein